jgi:3-phosphoshikimate 1-carboxyvinyltransferase
MSIAGQPQAFRLTSDGPLNGRVQVPGDKSISHRALMLGSLAVGRTRIEGLLESEDVHATAGAMRAMGATIESLGDSRWQVDGVGVGGLLQPESALDMGNSGTSTRLLMGLVASHPVKASFFGDASLTRRPMARVIVPLEQMGATFSTSPGGRLPLMVAGACPAIPVRYTLPVASAQVKSAILLAGLNTPGTTTVIERTPTRDHSERMLKGFGARLEVSTGTTGEREISLQGEAELRPLDIVVPGDPSSAAFLTVAALITPGSVVRVENVGMNPTRSGLFEVLAAMGARIEVVDEREAGGEPVADLIVRHSSLTAITDLPVGVVPRMVDEFPILFVAAALAEGRTVLRGLEELRVKESDRLRTMADGLSACGVAVEELADGLVIDGTAGEPVPGGATVETHLDHRIAMSFAVLGLRARQPVTVDDRRPINTSFPSFFGAMEALGAQVMPGGETLPA